MMEWPISDLLHLMKNARARLALALLAFTAKTRYYITGDSVTENLSGTHTTRDFQARKPLDLLKDDLAIDSVTLPNLLALWDKDDVNGAYFLLPYVALSLAMRNELLSVDTRLGLFEVAFQVFFDYVQHFPKTSRSKISEKTVKGCKRKTFWTRIMCERACNLCVGL
jgi:hypothetical protein